MVSKEQMVVFMNAIADQVEASCSEHETEDHGGEMCYVNRMSAVAFLAHRLGIKPGNASASSFTLLLDDYQQNCPHCKAKREAE